MIDETSKFSVLDFMVLRSPTQVKAEARWRNYVEDTYLRAPGEPRKQVALVTTDDEFSIFKRSSVAHLAYEAVFCGDANLRDLQSTLLQTLQPRYPPCEDRERAGAALQIEDLEKHAYIQVGDAYYLMPDTLDSLPGQSFFLRLAAILPILDEAVTAKPPVPVGLPALIKNIERIFNKPLIDLVFDNGGTSAQIRDAKRSLFDALYLLYIMRRSISINIEEIMRGLQAVHVLEALAVDSLASIVATGRATQNQNYLLQSLATIVPQLLRWNGASAPGIPLIGTQSDLAAYLASTPIIHPLISRLFQYKAPFNNVKPIGCGDLKVVKHWLTEYRVGEIAHIENVLKGEKRGRTRRDLEKTEEVFSFANEQSTQATKDTQTTDRFELKSESEKVAKKEMSVNVGASASFEYIGTGYKIVAGLTAGFAYNTANSDSSKLANTFARDVVSKAINNIQTRSVQSRTTTKTFETEETNSHRFDNTGAGGGHISGIYRWVDKVYTSQLYNYGKRMMFEFVLPEPAALFVEARLAAYEASLDIPRYPKKAIVAGLPQWLLDLEPSEIDEQRVRELSKRYDLSDFTYPQVTRYVDFIDSGTGKNFFSDHGLERDAWGTRTYMCRLQAKDYRITKLVLDGTAFFWGRPGLTGQTSNESNTPPPSDINTLIIWIDGFKYYEKINNAAERWFFYPGPGAEREIDIAAAPALAGDLVTLTFGFWDGWAFDMSVHAKLEMSDEALLEWQQKVYLKIRRAEEARVALAEQNAEQSFQSELATYRNRLDQLRAQSVDDLIQGRSEAFNQQVVLQELKRQCLSMITKEMDSASWDDIWADKELMDVRSVASDYHRFNIKESANGGEVTTTAELELVTKNRDLPVPKLEAAKWKGRIVQFLEQAFEWNKLSYITYPYFWTVSRRWYELMSRSDRTDPFFSAFLQAGSVRVLLAVTPGYRDAVLHYIATGQPWDGGSSPVIGDSLFVSLYDELREQQDDLINATAEGDPWTFSLPTSLVYLDNSSTPLPQPDAP